MRHLFIFSLLFILVQANAQSNFKIFNKQGKEISIDKFYKSLDKKQLIFFGEFHDCADIHWLQLQVTKYLHEKHGNKLVVGMEMFEADNQFIIDEYFGGLISTKNFEDECRLWKNYKTDYKPVVEFVRENNARLIATNIPRRYANSVFYNGIDHLKKFPSETKAYFAPLPIAIDTTLESNKQLMNMSMGGHKGQNMMEAQAVKDATMAHFIKQNMPENGAFLHQNGSFHSNKSEGILSFLKDVVSADQTLVITMVSQGQIDKLEDENKELADIIFCFTEDYAKTH